MLMKIGSTNAHAHTAVVSDLVQDPTLQVAPINPVRLGAVSVASRILALTSNAVGAPKTGPGVP